MSSETCQVEKADAVPVATVLLQWESLLAELQALNPASLKEWEARLPSQRFGTRPPPSGRPQPWGCGVF